MATLWKSEIRGLSQSLPIQSLNPSLLNLLLTVSVCQKVSTMEQRWAPTTR